ncbi:MAG TPA: hypothetical protein VNO83_12925 [Pseudonocardia sp.]|nr:hypothetical protein [Pseudonocardia sp.]
MGSEQDEWQVPAPIRVLVWWPPIAFILVTIAPQTAPVTIAAAGVLLAVIGMLGAALTSRPEAAGVPGGSAGEELLQDL